MKIVEEIVKIKGYAPKKIFVEVARGADEKTKNKSKDERRTKTRKTHLLDVYKNCKKDNQELFEILKNTEDNEFRRDALYLYFTQMGVCMYTGKRIDISDIFNKNLYDIDHIYPRSKIKDDSLDNRVLVTKLSNEEKGNTYPINQNIRRDRADFWKMLFSKGLISKKKFDSRSDALTHLDKMINAAKDEDLYEVYKAEFDALKAKLDIDKKQMLILKRSEFQPLLEEAIVTKYYYTEGSVEKIIQSDDQLHKALDLF
jgi:CRISPR subtype II RNA-guided endonuclease Cas9/Csn1